MGNNKIVNVEFMKLAEEMEVKKHASTRKRKSNKRNVFAQREAKMRAGAKSSR